MFETDHSMIERAALLDGAETDRVAFARRSISWAKEHGHSTVVWSFAAKNSVSHIRSPSKLSKIADQLRRQGRVTVGGVNVILETPRMQASANVRGAPVSAWWADDDRLLKLEGPRPSRLDALVSGTQRAPIWLSAFQVEFGREDRGEDEADETPVPILISEELQEGIASRSRAMNLNNGVHDSLAGSLVDYARAMVKAGSASAEEIAVAALRSGWQPRSIPGLLKKVAIR